MSTTQQHEIYCCCMYPTAHQLHYTTRY